MLRQQRRGRQEVRHPDVREHRDRPGEPGRQAGRAALSRLHRQQSPHPAEQDQQRAVLGLGSEGRHPGSGWQEGRDRWELLLPLPPRQREGRHPRGSPRGDDAGILPGMQTVHPGQASGDEPARRRAIRSPGWLRGHRSEAQGDGQQVRDPVRLRTGAAL